MLLPRNLIGSILHYTGDANLTNQPKKKEAETNGWEYYSSKELTRGKLA